MGRESKVRYMKCKRKDVVVGEGEKEKIVINGL